MNATVLDLVIMILGILATVFVGLWTSRKVTNTGEFFLAGRAAPLLFLAGTLAATEIHPGTVVGQASRGFDLGLYGLWWPIIFGLSLVFYAMTLADKYARLRETTVADFMRARFGDWAGGLVSLILIVTMSVLLGVYLFGTQLVLNLALGWEMWMTTAILFTLAVLYTVTGGFRASLFADTLNAGMLLVGLISAFIFAWFLAGGFSRFGEVFPPEKLSLMPLSPEVLPELSYLIIIGYLINQCGVWAGAPWYAQRMFAAKDRPTAYRAFWINVVIVTFVYTIGQLTAAFVRVAYPDIQPDMAIPYALVMIAPPFFTGLALAGMVAVYMSTVSSILNTNATMIMHDWYIRYIKPGASDAHYLMVSRIATLAMAIFSVIVTFWITGIFWWFIMHVGLALGMSLVAIYAGFYWWRSTQAGVVAGLLAAIAWYAIALIAGVHLSWVAIGVHVTTLVVTIGVSLATRPMPEEKLVAFFDRVGAPVFGKREYLAAKGELPPAGVRPAPTA